MKTTGLKKEAIRDTASTIMQSLSELENITLNYKQRRDLKKSLQRLVKKNSIVIENVYHNENEVSQFIVNVFDGDIKSSQDGVKVTIKFLREQRNDSGLNTQPRSYQREKVASYEWKCEIIKTILVDKCYPIPAIHIRIVRNENGDVVGYEVADGQQRVTAVFDFMDNQFTLPNLPSFKRYAGMNWAKMLHYYPDATEEIKNYGLSTTFYDNFTDEDISTLFIKILNNTNDLNVQEKNNATRSRLADFIRYTSRNGNGEWKDKKSVEMFHDLFSRDVLDKGTPKELIVWKYFNNLGIGRMEGDLWLAMLVYMVVNDNWKKGVTPMLVSRFYEDTSVESGHDTGWNFKKKLSTNSMPKIEKEITNLLDIGLKFSKWVLKYKTTKINSKGKEVRSTSNAKVYLKPNFMLFVILFARDYKEAMKSGAVDWDLYFEKITDVYDKWNSASVYEKDENGNSRYQSNGTTMLGAFKALWGSFNSNVIRTASNIVSSEIALDPDWGFVKIDRSNFTKKQIEQRYEENGGIDDYTGKPIQFEDAIGDHDIPRAWGIAKGGVTEYSNLKITTAYHNGQKLTMTGEAYMAKLREDKKAA